LGLGAPAKPKKSLAQTQKKGHKLRTPNRVSKN